MTFNARTSCSCIKELQNICGFNIIPATSIPSEPSSFLDDPEFGRMVYTISILLMFSLVIVLLMIRSIKRSTSTIQMEALLDAMRFREELDLQERQRRRLLKAKTKVSAWLTRTHGIPGETRGWRSSPQLIQQPRKQTSSTVSEIPRVVVTVDADQLIPRAHTPCLSLMYDFNEHEIEIGKYNVATRSSICSESSLGRESFTSRGSVSLDIEQYPPRLSLESHSMSIG